MDNYSKLIESIKLLNGYESFKSIEVEDDRLKLTFDTLPIYDSSMDIYKVIAKHFDIPICSFLSKYHYDTYAVLYIYLYMFKNLQK
jgi:hypothetical protein